MRRLVLPTMNSPAQHPPLVTGGTGFAGSHLLDRLLESRPSAYAWGNSAGSGVPPSPAGPNVVWSAVDVTDPRAVADALRLAPPSAVYHCAGIADVQSAWRDAARALRVNAMGTRALLDGLERAGLDVPVIVVGSALIYAPSAGALTEDAPIAPASPYGVSKLAQELMASASSLSRVLIARPFNHAGPRQSATYVTSSFARQIVEAELGRRPPVLRVGNLDARRDITDVRDTVRAYELLMERGERGTPYNVCRGEAYRVGDLLDSLLRRARVAIRVETDAARLRPSDNPVVLGSAARLRAATGWEPRIPIDKTLDDLLEFWRESLQDGPAA